MNYELWAKGKGLKAKDRGAKGKRWVVGDELRILNYELRMNGKRRLKEYQNKSISVELVLLNAYVSILFLVGFTYQPTKSHCTQCLSMSPSFSMYSVSSH